MKPKNHVYSDAVHTICVICMFLCTDTILLRKWLTTDVWKFGPEITDVTCPRKT